MSDGNNRQAVRRRRKTRKLQWLRRRLPNYPWLTAPCGLFGEALAVEAVKTIEYQRKMIEAMS